MPRSLLSASWNPANRPRGLALDLDRLPRHLGRLSAGRDGEVLKSRLPGPLFKCTVPGTDLGMRTCTHAHTHSYLSSTLVTPEGPPVQEVGGYPSKGSLEPPECPSQWGPRTVVRKPGGQMGQHRDTPCNSFHKYPWTSPKPLQYPEGKVSGRKEGE